MLRNRPRCTFDYFQLLETTGASGFPQCPWSGKTPVFAGHTRKEGRALASPALGLRRLLLDDYSTLRAKSSTTKEVWSETSSLPTRKIWTVCPMNELRLKLFCEKPVAWLRFE